MRRKQRSRILGVARARIGGLNAIGSNLDFGNGLTTDALANLLAETEVTITTYNRLLGEVDSTRRAVRRLEKELADLCDRILKAVAAYYGTSSDEYGKVGGVPKAERKRPQRPTPVDPETPPAAPATGA
jgi:hypothetical protein